MLFTCTRYIVGGVFLGCGSFAGVLHLTSDFLKTLGSLEGSLVNDEKRGGFWYLSTIRLQHNDFMDPFVSYPYPPENKSVSGSSGDTDQKKDFSTDKTWTDQIREKCLKLKDSMNLLINESQVKRFKKWCTLGDTKIDDKFKQILDWEYEKTCRVIVMNPSDSSTTSSKSSSQTTKKGWYIPFILKSKPFKDSQISSIYGQWNTLKTASSGDNADTLCQKNGVIILEWDSTKTEWKKHDDANNFIKNFGGFYY